MERKKRVTIQDVADAVGVSKSTVSLALAEKGNFSPETRQAIFRAAQRLNFVPNPQAQRLSSQRYNNTIALFTLSLDLGVGTQKLQLIQRRLIDSEFDVPIYASNYLSERERHVSTRLVKNLRLERPRAIICSVNGLLPEAIHELEQFQAEGGVVVCYDTPVEIGCDKVVFDREDNTYQAARHLLEQGHRTVAFCMQGPVRKFGDRFEGFSRALREFDVPLNEDWLFGTVGRDTLYELAGVEMAQSYLRLRKRPTGVCILDDYTAIGFAAELERAGLRVPADVSIVGHDNTPIASCGTLPLTTVTHPIEEIVGHVLEFLHSRLQGYSGPPRAATVYGRLIERHSVRPYPPTS